MPAGLNGSITMTGCRSAAWARPGLLSLFARSDARSSEHGRTDVVGADDVPGSVGWRLPRCRDSVLERSLLGRASLALAAE
jgi:hypothetical protein